jgi:Flp pilus assembly protein TadG
VHSAESTCCLLTGPGRWSRAMLTRLRSRRESGQELVEYSILLPLFLVLVLAIIEFSIIIFSYDTIANAAREGARAGIIPDVTDAEVMAIVCDRALALNLTEDNVTITRGELVRVEVTYDVQLLTGPLVEALGGSSTLPLRTVATMMSE